MTELFSMPDAAYFPLTALRISSSRSVAEGVKKAPRARGRPGAAGLCKTLSASLSTQASGRRCNPAR